MAIEGEKKVFEVELEASSLVKEIRESYATGKTRSYKWRMSQLQRLVQMLEHHEQEIAEAIVADLSKPKFEALAYEVAMLKNSCSLAIKKLKHWMVPEKVKTSITTFPSSAEIVPEPLGVVLVISPWNYPFLLSLDPVIGAIAAGNAVVLKPSEVSPATSSLLAKLVGEYMDNSLIRVVEGGVAETTALLEQKWDKICYTGNGKVGRIVMAAAAKHLTPVLLELGGKSPVVVDSSINLQVATRRIIAGKWGCNNGQTCVAPDYVLTTKDFAPKLVDALKHELEHFFGENPLDSKDLSRIVNSNHFARLTKLLDEDRVSGTIVYGGKSEKSTLKISPTILLDAPRDSLIMNEEIFGPLLPILTVEKVEDSFDIINSGTKPLAAYLFTNNKKLKEQFVMTVSAGGVIVNDTVLHLSVDGLPFGGVQESGMGAYHGKFSFDAFSHKKAVLYRSFAGDAPVRYPPYTKGKLRLMKALIGGSILSAIFALFGLSKD
ncbi:aldehyde dehydrogenase family 3 member H1 isoform X2 [Juglans microcarpa x Juglans regia]|uniref:aldehyde dehydrogenase family 3 member H1 isoform X2 n=1 Tax=Juglans microcarpa x Juglans regia TaxID=2249226 RepID=UPI001B7F62A7|nr:aldehyde dehydrogenase family 3 member H1 isoform X2 [Juglans microcarpa x Juglans regia]